MTAFVFVFVFFAALRERQMSAIVERVAGLQQSQQNCLARRCTANNFRIPPVNPTAALVTSQASKQNVL